MATQKEMNRGGGAYTTPGIDAPPEIGPSKIITSAPEVTFVFDRVEPPSSLYITRDDSIRIRTTCSVAGVVLTVGWRMLDAQTKRITFNDAVINPASDSVSHDVFLQPGEGFLLGLLIGVTTTAPDRGQLFISGHLSRGNQASSVSTQILFADYVVGFIPVGWPGGRIVSPIEGMGFCHSIQQANPAAGADWSFTVPLHKRMRIQCINAQLATSAAVANRIPRLHIADPSGNFVWQAAPSQVVPASLNEQVSFGQNVIPFTTDNLSTNTPLPGTLYLPAGSIIAPSTTGLQAADQWSTIWLHVEEWLTVDA